jgi:aminoglycoside phosphotransferase family enzyme
MELVTKTLLEVNSKFTKERTASLENQFARGWRELVGEDWDDIRTMMRLASERISQTQADDIIRWLKELTSRHSLFDGYPARGLSVAIDNNCDNLLLVDGKVFFIDVLAPKESWRVVEEYFSITRTAVDAYVLGSSDLGDAVYRVYGEFRGQPELAATLLCEIRSALIQWPYRHILGQHELAEKYKAFVIPKIALLNDLASRRG